MGRGTTVWLFGTLCFVGTIHALEALLALFFGRELILLSQYPIIGSMDINLILYLGVSLTSTVIFWGITCKAAFETPLDQFLDKVLSDAQMQSEVEGEIVEDHRSVLDMICQTLTSNSKLLAQTKDMACNVRSELVSLRPLKTETEGIGQELKNLKKEICLLKESFKKPNCCPSCGNPVLSRFKICPYCGETLQLSPETIIVGKFK